MTYDLAIFQPPAKSGGNYMQALAVPGVPGRAIAGSEKLAQRFLVTLLTPLGSIPYQPLVGTSLPARLGGNNFLTEFDALSTFAAVLPSVAAQLKSNETSSMPNDERFGSATIAQIVVGDTSTSVTFTITSLAGMSAGLTIPLSFGGN